MWDSVLAIRHRFAYSLVGDEELFALLDAIDRLYVLSVASKEEITVGSATVINLAGFEEEDCSNWSEAVLLVSRRFFWVLPLPNHG